MTTQDNYLDHDKPMTKAQRRLHVIGDPTKDIITLNDWYSIYQPENPFKCNYILLWFKGNPIIKEITIGNMQQLAVSEIPATLLASPVTLKTIREWFVNGVIDEMLKAHHVVSLTLSTIKPSERFTMKINGPIDVIALYGVELVEVK